MLRHLQALTWHFADEGRTVWAIAPYAEPHTQADGSVRYRPRLAAESGREGFACVDDAARAALLAFAIAEGQGLTAGAAEVDRDPEGGDAAEVDGDPAGGKEVAEVAPWAESLRWARRWLTFVRYMRLPDGRFANFALDRAGTRNLTGMTSRPGGAWWTGRALWALARAARLLGSDWALEAWARCPLPELDGEGKTLGLFALAGCELLDVEPVRLAPPLRDALREQQGRVRPLVGAWCERIVAGGGDYFRDFPGVDGLPLWGYHQLHGVARAAATLGRGDLLAPCVATARTLAEPVIAAGGYFSWDPRTGGTRAGMCAYCISSLVQGLGALFDLTGSQRHRALALDGAQWLYGRNSARVPLYDPRTGRCADGLDGPEADRPSVNYGAESAIEAGFMELERRRLESV